MAIRMRISICNGITNKFMEIQLKCYHIYFYKENWIFCKLYNSTYLPKILDFYAQIIRLQIHYLVRNILVTKFYI